VQLHSPLLLLLCLHMVRYAMRAAVVLLLHRPVA
jgi:hypothetical protein